MPKIILEREKCIGCGTCAVICPQYWEMGEDGLSNLKESEKNKETGNMERVVEEEGCNREAAESCPAQCIHITNN